jgi:hypothetical protein
MFFFACSFKPSFLFGRSIPAKTLAIVAAEIDVVAAATPTFLLGCSDLDTSSVVLGSFPLFNSPIAIATSAESL